MVDVRQEYLRSGDTTSCGCYKRLLLGERNTTHGQSSTPAYRKWLSMKERVARPTRKNTCYEGVTICKRWEKFRHFLQDMGHPPEGYTLERKDSSKGYSPSNCIWIPAAKQAQNTRRNVFVAVAGVRVCLSEAARMRGLPPDVVMDRINRLGWSMEKALGTPKRKLVRRGK